eukprot:545478-Hanusia_phi.AAC.1
MAYIMKILQVREVVCEQQQQQQQQQTSRAGEVKSLNGEQGLKDQKRRVLERVRDEEGFSVLHLAAYSNFLPLLRTILPLGIEVDSRSKRLLTPLHLAIAAGRQA